MPNKPDKTEICFSHSRKTISVEIKSEILLYLVLSFPWKKNQTFFLVISLSCESLKRKQRRKYNNMADNTLVLNTTVHTTYTVTTCKWSYVWLACKSVKKKLIECS